MRVSGWVAFLLGLEQWSHNFRGSKVQKNRLKLARIGVFQPKCHSLKQQYLRRYKRNQVEIWTWSRDQGVLTKITKLGHKGAWPRSRDLFLNFGPPYYLRFGWSYKRQILQPDQGLGILNKKNAKLGQKGARPWSRDLLLNFGTPYYLQLGWSYKRQILQPDRG